MQEDVLALLELLCVICMLFFPSVARIKSIDILDNHCGLDKCTFTYVIASLGTNFFFFLSFEKYSEFMDSPDQGTGHGLRLGGHSRI